jgi:hypothetical protein
MEELRRGAFVRVGTCFLVAFLLGCESAQQKAAEEQATVDAANKEAESRSVAVNSLGDESEVVLRGDLALNGREQILVVNRFRNGPVGSSSGGTFVPILITRAALLEKDGGTWAEILHCDEHVKNPNGYLGGFPKAPISGWRLEYARDANAGIEMKFTPAETVTTAGATVGNGNGSENASLDVRWNKNTKRYQSFDRSHERYLNELPTLETPESFLR